MLYFIVKYCILCDNWLKCDAVIAEASDDFYELKQRIMGIIRHSQILKLYCATHMYPQTRNRS